MTEISESFRLQMVLENTPDEFLYPDRDDIHFQPPASHWSDYLTDEEYAEALENCRAVAVRLQSGEDEVIVAYGHWVTTSKLIGEAVYWERNDGVRGAFLAADVSTDLTDDELDELLASANCPRM